MQLSDESMNGKIIIFSILLSIILICGCALKPGNNTTSYRIEYQTPDIASIIKDYPNASTTVIEYGKEAASEKIEEWRASCPNLSLSEYKVMNISLPPRELIVWIDNQTNQIVCSKKINQTNSTE
jgi:hypothetical protein